LPVWHKAAVLLLALGDDLASEVMRSLSDEEMEQMTRALAELKQVPTSMQDEALAQFEAALVAGKPASGVVDFARRLLEKALGLERAEEMLARVSHG
jgi:flagellar motor switch protein FliG